MNNYKFRFWCNGNCADNPNFSSKGWWRHDDILLNKYHYGSQLFNTDYLIPCLYTGLLDNDGKEIYEGDILSCHAFDGWFDTVGHNFNFEVKHSIIKSGESDISGFVRVPESRVVIGNVFETPELINK